MDTTAKPSLETIIENEEIGIETFHPGGLEITDELCTSMNLNGQMRVLEIGSGSGESACHIAEAYHCPIVGIDQSAFLLEKARNKAETKKLEISFQLADAHQLPFENDSFDAVIAECVMTLLDREQALKEIRRVLKPGGILGIHDISWKESASEKLKERLFQLENETTETKEGWKLLLERIGFTDIATTEKPHLMSTWITEIKKKIGFFGLISIFYKIFKKWGVTGILKVKETESIFTDEHMGYVLISAWKC